MGKGEKVKDVKFYNFFKNKQGNQVVDDKKMCYDKKNEMKR